MRATIVGPNNCPRCRAEHMADAIQAEIDAHVHGVDCGEPLVRFGFTRWPRCLLNWWPGPASSARSRLGRLQHVIPTLEHHCRPHRCDFGPNCGSFEGEAIR